MGFGGVFGAAACRPPERAAPSMTRPDRPMTAAVTPWSPAWRSGRARVLYLIVLPRGRLQRQGRVLQEVLALRPGPGAAVASLRGAAVPDPAGRARVAAPASLQLLPLPLRREVPDGRVLPLPVRAHRADLPHGDPGGRARRHPRAPLGPGHLRHGGLLRPRPPPPPRLHLGTQLEIGRAAGRERG